MRLAVTTRTLVNMEADPYEYRIDPNSLWR